jgi:hypothetical protein
MPSRWTETAPVTGMLLRERSSYRIFAGHRRSPFATKHRVGRRRQMCRMKARPKWDDRLDAIPPLAGTLVAFISLLFVAMIVMR